jgi:hypothetical protein
MTYLRFPLPFAKLVLRNFRGSTRNNGWVQLVMRHNIGYILQGQPGIGLGTISSLCTKY